MIIMILILLMILIVIILTDCRVGDGSEVGADSLNTCSVCHIVCQDHITIITVLTDCRVRTI